MPNQRAPGQILLTFPAKEALDEALERGVQAGVAPNKSQLIRDSIREKLQRCNIDVPLEAVMPPGRSGKGGPKRTRDIYPPHGVDRGTILNDQNLPPSSGVASALKPEEEIASVLDPNKPPKPAPSREADEPIVRKAAPARGTGKHSKKKPASPA